MRTEAVWKDFIKYVSLNILGQMAYSCYTLADTFFVSADLGADGLAALNLAFPMLCLINGVGLMLGMGGGTRYSILKSRGEDARANRMFSASICMAALCSLLFVALGALCSRELSALLGADGSISEMTDTYLRVMLLFAPAFLANHVLQCFVRNDGRPSLATTAMMTGSLSNIVLDYIFIFPLGMGIFGAIFATCLAPIISILVLSPYLLRRKNGFRFRLALPRPAALAEIVSSGIPPFVTEITSGVVMFLFNFIILGLAGNVGVAAFSVITVISLVVIAIYTGLSQGIQPVLSVHHGMGRPGNVKKILCCAFVTALLLSGAIYSVLFFGAPQLAALFNQEGNVQLQQYAVTGMKLSFLACPFVGFNIVTATYFTSTERPRPGQIISLSRGIFILIPMAFFLSSLWEMTGVWCAYPLTECVVSIIGGVFLFRSRRLRPSR